MLVAFILNCEGTLVENFLSSEINLWTETIFLLEFVSTGEVMTPVISNSEIPGDSTNAVLTTGTLSRVHG